MITNLENKHYASTYVLLNTDIPCKVVILKATSLVSLIEGNAFTFYTHSHHEKKGRVKS